MKKLLLTLTLLTTLALTATAIPAKPGLWRNLKLTDGTEVRLYEIIDGVHRNGSADMDVPETIWEFFSQYFK